MDEKLKDKKVESKLSIIGPVAALLATIIATYANLPPILQYIMTLSVTVLALVSVYVVVWHHIANLFKKVVNAIKHYLLVKEYLSQFSLFVDRLYELSRNDRSDSMPRAFTDIQHLLKEFNYPNSLAGNLSNFLPAFKEWIREFRKRDFLLLISWFEFILRIFNRHLVLEPFRQLRNMDQNKLNMNVKEIYEKNREHYIRFLQDYENFARTINNKAGETIALAYFDKPGTLSNG